MGINDAHHGSDRRPIRARSSSNNAGGGAPRLRRLRTHPCPLPTEPAWLTRARIVEAGDKLLEFRYSGIDLPEITQFHGPSFRIGSPALFLHAGDQTGEFGNGLQLIANRLRKKQPAVVFEDQANSFGFAKDDQCQVKLRRRK